MTIIQVIKLSTLKQEILKELANIKRPTMIAQKIEGFLTP